MKKPSPPSIITVAVITTITIIFWVFFEVYQILTGEVDVEISQQLLKPLNPTLNQEVLSSLKGRIEFDKDSVTHFSTAVKVDTATENAGGDLTPTLTISEAESEDLPATPSGEMSE